jgi:calcineurin-like phosphoesterase family protein
MSLQNNKIWFVGDLRLGDDRITTKDSKLVRRHRSYVTNVLEALDACVSASDVLVLMGHTVVGKERLWWSKVKELPGQKRVLLGPLERKPKHWYEKWVDDVTGWKEIVYLEAPAKYDYLGSIMLSHLPAFPTVLTNPNDFKYADICRRFEKWYSDLSCGINFHGHTLGLGVEDHRTYDVGVDSIGFAPRSLEQVIELAVKR